MKKHLPNFITLLNLAAGCVALIMVFYDQTTWVLILMFTALIADFMDGLIARLLHVKSETGKQLDSLSDLVSFGILPAAMIFITLKSILLGDPELSIHDLSLLPKVMLGLIVIVPIFAALRLARFNLLDDLEIFIGLPTPAFAIFWTGIYYNFSLDLSIFGQTVNAWFFMALVLVMTLFMLIPLPMLSLKFSNFSFVPNFSRYLLIVLSLIIILLTGIPGLTLVVLTYILLSLLRILLT